MQPPQDSDMVPNQTLAANTACTSEISIIFKPVPPPPRNPISHETPVTSTAPSSSPPSVTRITEEKEEEKEQKIKDSLYNGVMDGLWNRVISIYFNHKEVARTAKITDSKETALHMAISDGKPDVVNKLLEYIDDDVIREMTDHREENPLHLAASLGTSGYMHDPGEKRYRTDWS